MVTFCVLVLPYWIVVLLDCCIEVAAHYIHCFFWTGDQGVHMRALRMVQFLSGCLLLRIGYSCCYIWWLSCRQCGWLPSALRTCSLSRPLNNRNLWASVLYCIVHWCSDVIIFKSKTWLWTIKTKVISYAFVVISVVENFLDCSIAFLWHCWFGIRKSVWPLKQVLSWDWRPFGHNRHGPKIGELCPFSGGGAGSLFNTLSPGSRPSSLPSGILAHPAVWP